MGREDVHDPVDRLGGRVGVQGGKGQMAGLRDLEAGFDGLKIAHLADQHDVGILSQAGAQRVGEAVGVRVDLPLIDDAGLVAVEVLDRVLDGHDVLVALAIDLVDHRREARGLAGPRRSGDQDQAARFLAEGLGELRQAQLLE